MTAKDREFLFWIAIGLGSLIMSPYSPTVPIPYFGINYDALLAMAIIAFLYSHKLISTK